MTAACAVVRASRVLIAHRADALPELDRRKRDGKCGIWLAHSLRARLQVLVSPPIINAARAATGI
jgi:hypothetical protein